MGEVNKYGRVHLLNVVPYACEDSEHLLAIYAMATYPRPPDSASDRTGAQSKQ